MIDLIFKPVVFVAGFGLILIFVASIQNIMQGTLPQQLNGANISVNASGALLDIENISSIQVNEGNSILGANSSMGQDAITIGQTIFVNLIIFFLTIFLIRQFIRISIGKEGPIANVVNPAADFIEKYAKTLPVIPFGGGASRTALTTTAGQTRKNLAEGFGFDIDGRSGERNKEGKFVYNTTKFDAFLADKMGMQAPWSPEDYTSLNKIATKDKNISNFFMKSQELSQSRSGGLNVFGNSSWFDAFKKLTQNTKTQATFGGAFLPDTADEAAMTAFFATRGSNGKTNAAIVFELLGGEGNVISGSRTIPTDYEQLKAITFGKNS